MRRLPGATPLAAALVGAALGLAVLAAGALLLYTGAGLLSSIGFLAGFALVALAAGIWGGWPDRAGPPRPVPLRWAAAALTLAAGAAFAHAWLGSATLQGDPLARSLAVLLLLGLPAYLSGSLISWLAAADPASGAAAAAAAVAGAAAGVALAAVLLVPNVDPAVIFLTGAAAVAAAGSIHAAAAPPARKEPSMPDRVAIVTGVGSRGQVGWTIARAFRDAGARVVVADLVPAVEELAAELGGPGEAVGVAADLTTSDGVDRVVAAARERYGRLDALVNAAGGLTTTEPVERTGPEDWAREHDRNATTAFLMCRAALPLLRESRGAIVNFASPAALRAPAGLAAYSAAKAAVVALTSSLAAEEAGRGVRVNALAPGMIDTEQNRASVADPEAVAWVTREEVARIALFLAGDDSSGISGETIRVLGAGLE